MTPQQARQILENTKTGNPEVYTRTCLQIATEAPVWAMQAISRDQKLFALMKEYEERFQKLVQAVAKISGMPANGVAEATNGTSEAPSAPSSPSQRINADGTPMSPEDAALEDMMDAASAGMSPNEPDAGNPSQAPAVPPQAVRQSQKKAQPKNDAKA